MSRQLWRRSWAESSMEELGWGQSATGLSASEWLFYSPRHHCPGTSLSSQVRSSSLFQQGRLSLTPRKVAVSAPLWVSAAAFL